MLVIHSGQSELMQLSLVHATEKFLPNGFGLILLVVKSKYQP
jgi:hypothetical protein